MDLNIRAKTTKCLEKTEDNPYDLGLNKYFSDMTPKAKCIK